MPQTQTAYIPLAGGLDLVSPALTVRPGYLLDSLNYVPGINGGYRRVAGYTRYDGQDAERSQIQQPPGNGAIEGVYEPGGLRVRIQER